MGRNCQSFCFQKMFQTSQYKTINICNVFIDFCYGKKYHILKFWMPENVCFPNEIIKKQITVFRVGHEEELREKMQSKHICILQQLCGELRQCASPPRRRHHRGRTLAQLCYSLKFLNKMGQVLVKPRPFFGSIGTLGFII